MTLRKKGISRVTRSWHHGAIVLAGCLLLSGSLAGQQLPASVAVAAGQLPNAPRVLVAKAHSAPADATKNQDAHAAVAGPIAAPGKQSAPYTTPSGVRRITLEEAQQMAGSASGNPMVRLGQLQVEMAKQTRLGTVSMFFPQIGSMFENFHFNKFMGQRLSVANRSVALPLTGKDQTFAAATATQPITPLLQLRQLYKINVADERIAMAKAGMPVGETVAKVEKDYYGLLVAQQQFAVARANIRVAQSKWLLASTSATPVATGSHDVKLLNASKALAIADTRVKELTASLDDLLGLPAGTELELVPPNPPVEDISLAQATQEALAANPKVIEAEQNVIKARAASTVKKLAYVPTVAVMGGYAYNSNAIPLLPRDFSFVGVVANYTLFDFGKREHEIKGAKAQAEMAELALQLTKAKVSAAVKTSYLQMETMQTLSELTHRIASATRSQNVSAEGQDPNVAAAQKAKIQAEMFQADLNYRQALTKLKTLMGEE